MLFGLNPQTILEGLLKNPAIAAHLQTAIAEVQKVDERIARIERKLDAVIASHELMANNLEEIRENAREASLYD